MGLFDKEKAVDILKQEKKFCQWCGKDMESYDFDTYLVIKKTITQPFYFDSKECLYNWTKGLLQAEVAR